jgi:hypothetical protein
MKRDPERGIIILPMHAKFTLTKRAVVLAFLFLAASYPGMQATDRAESNYVGQPLAEALEELQARGLSLIYSSDLVQADLVVESEPRGSSLIEVLIDILAPHNLKVERGPGQGMSL